MVTTKVLKLVDVQISAIKMVLPVRYGEEDIPNNFPGREGKVLTLVVDLSESDHPYDGAVGTIRDWPSDFGPFYLHMKVVDEGAFYLLGEDGEVIGERTDSYVPGWVPGEFGDYVVFNIGGGGRIKEPFVLDFDGDDRDTVDWIS